MGEWIIFNVFVYTKLSHFYWIIISFAYEKGLPMASQTGISLNKISGGRCELEKTAPTPLLRWEKPKVKDSFRFRRKGPELLKDMGGNRLCPLSCERSLHSSNSVSPSPACSFLFSFLFLATCSSSFTPCHSPLSFRYIEYPLSVFSLCQAPFYLRACALVIPST